VIDERFYGLIELGLFFGLILGWAGWQALEAGAGAPGAAAGRAA